MTFSLGATSREHLVGVHPILVSVVQEAIRLSEVDFRVHEGLRSEARQKKLLEIGATTTLKSNHLIQADGFGHAVDLVPWVDFDGDGNAELRWDWPLAYKIARAMQRAASAQAIAIRWGGCWDRPLNGLGDPESASHDYVRRRLAAKQRAFIDGPHFELGRNA